MHGQHLEKGGGDGSGIGVHKLRGEIELRPAFQQGGVQWFSCAR
jgi:hypothetical protein